jgi:hypothetical protein
MAKIYYCLEDDVESICLDCHHIGNTHFEYEIDGQEEAKVVCPMCFSSAYFIATEEEKTNALHI